MKLKQIISAALITALFPFGTGITALGSEEDTVKELPNADVEITESGGVIHFDYGNDYTVLLDSDSGISTASDYPILSTTLPTSYNNDPSSLQYITSPKNQGSLGTCWDFSATSCIETLLMMKDNATDAALDEYNLSEMHPALAMSDSFLQDDGSYGYVGRTYSGGGNGEIYNTYMTRAADADNNIFVGPVEESDMAYSTSSATINAITASKMNIDTTGGYFPGTFSSLDFTGATLDTDDKTARNEIIKTLVNDYGSVSVSIYCGAYSSNSYENFKDSADGKYSLFYQSENEDAANHAVTIVGYNDSFDKDIFINAGYSEDNEYTEPTMNGAFIVKNSWGTGWGNNSGYFYMSYDSYLDTIYAFGDLVSRDTYDYIYDYTPYTPISGANCYSDSETNPTYYFGSYANYFEKQSGGSEKINKISVYVMSPDTTLNLYIDTDATDGKFNNPTAVAATEIGNGSASYTVDDSGNITVPYAGNYVFELAEPVEVDNDFTVIVYAESKNGRPIAYESTYSSLINHKYTGNGYISSSVNGTYTTAYEATSSYLDYMIRAYTEEVPVTVTVDGYDYTASYGDILNDVLSENSISDTVYETVSGEDNSYKPADTNAAVTYDITLYTSSYICAPTIELNNYQTLTEDGNNIIRFVGEITDNLDDKVSTITALGFVYSTDGSETATTTTTDLYSSLESYTPEDGIYLFKSDELTAGDYTVSAYVKYKLTDSEDVITVYTSEQTITTSSE